MTTNALQDCLVATRSAAMSRGRKDAGIGLWGLLPLLLLGWALNAVGATLNAVTHSALPGDRVQIRLTFSEASPDPVSFAIDNPARIALDFPGVALNLPRRTADVGVGMARSVTAVESGGRTRVVLNLVRLVPYEVKADGRDVLVLLESGGASGGALGYLGSPKAAGAARHSIETVDFRRGEQGQARLLVTLSDANIVADTREEGGKIIVEFQNSSLPERLARKLDVVDFATPVTMVDTYARGKNVRIDVSPKGDYEHLAYQSDNLFTLEVKPVTPEDAERARREKVGFTGERLSLNFQNIEVRAVLQLLADFTGMNLVASDTVTGSVTLRLKNVPWDQALDIILKSKGLGKREVGNVLMVAPVAEIAARERLELESQRQVEELAPLRTDFVQVNYAKARDIAAFLKAEKNTLLSERGNVTVDERTNTLLVRDTQDNLEAIRRLVVRLDIPVRQVLIESRIVIADDTFSRDLGVKFGLSKTTPRGGSLDRRVYTVGGKLPGDTVFPANTAFHTANRENFIVDLGIPSPSAALGIAIGHFGSYLLQLELQAMQQEGRGEILSNPRVVTSNQKEARIEQGVEIPYSTASQQGTATQFKKAVLGMSVTPQITPDGRVILDLEVTKDSRGEETASGPAINKQSVNTQVLVENGETVVLGGIYEQTIRNDTERVPFFSDLPMVGSLFRNSQVRDRKSELLIFVTPRILSEAIAVR